MDASLFQGDLVTTNRILYTPSVFARMNLLHLQEIGELQAEKPHTSQRNNLQSYLFMIVLNGKGALSYDGREYTLLSGQCVWIDCRKSYAHRTSEDLWKLRWIHFYGPNLHAVYEKYQERGGTPIITTQKSALFSQQWQKLYAIAATFDHIRDMRINEQLSILLTLLMTESWHPETQRKSILKSHNLQQIKDYLDQHYGEKITLDELANHFFINKFYLSRIFHEQFGMTIGSYIMSVRITHAKYLLRFSDLSLEETAVSCGFQSVNYFVRIFKKAEGVGPGEYRRKW